MAVAYECPNCFTRWPYFRTFQVCPECSIPCRSAVTPRSLTAGEAQSRLTRIAFIRYYEDRERERLGPTPEEVGEREAREEILRIRALEESLNEKDPGV